MFDFGQKVRVKKIVRRPDDDDETIDALQFYVGRVFRVAGKTGDGDLHYLGGVPLEFYADELEAVDETTKDST